MLHPKNILEWKSSSVGVVIIAAAIASVFVKDYSWVSVTPVLGLGGWFLGIKDSTIFGSKDTGAQVVVIALLIAGLGSCKVHQNTGTVTDSTIERLRDTTIFIKGSSVTKEVNDSLTNALHDLVRRGLNPQVAYSSDKNVNLRFALDSAGHLQATCASKDETINLLLKEVQRIHREKEVKYYPHVPEWMKAGFMFLFSLVFVETLIIYLLIKKPQIR